MEILFRRSTYLGILRFSLFLALFLASRYVYYYFDRIPFMAAILQPCINFLSRMVLVSSKAFFSVFYGHVTILSGFILAINGNKVLQVIFGCTGIIQLFQITVMLLFYPIGWKQKAYLYPVSVVIIVLASILHFVMLVPIAYHYPSLFQIFHDNLSRILFFGIVFLIWLIWERIRKTEPVLRNEPCQSDNRSDLTKLLSQTRLETKKNWYIAALVLSLGIQVSLIFRFAEVAEAAPWITRVIYIDKLFSFGLTALVTFVALRLTGSYCRQPVHMLYGLLAMVALYFVLAIVQQLTISVDFQTLGLLTNIFGLVTGILLFYFYLYHANQAI